MYFSFRLMNNIKIVGHSESAHCALSRVLKRVLRRQQYFSQVINRIIRNLNILMYLLFVVKLSKTFKGQSVDYQTTNELSLPLLISEESYAAPRYESMCKYHLSLRDCRGRSVFMCPTHTLSCPKALSCHSLFPPLTPPETKKTCSLLEKCIRRDTVILWEVNRRDVQTPVGEWHS